MPFGNVTQKLGIANPRVYNSAEFAQTVLRLSPGCPIYQQMNVHVRGPAYFFHGPGASAEWECYYPDDEINNNYTIREISPCDTQFARRNLADALPLYRFIQHRLDYTNQIYYVLNEPEAGSNLNPNPIPPPSPPPQNPPPPPVTGICRCWDPRDRNVDQHVAACFQPDPINSFWEDVLPPNGYTQRCGMGSYKRIREDALAYVYLRLRRETNDLGRGHIVLPPSWTNPLLGAGTEPYYQEFFDYVMGGVTIGTCPHEFGISPSDLTALHVHRYAEDPSTNEIITSPLNSVAYDAYLIRQGTNWFRTRYFSGGPMELNLLLSEAGSDHLLDGKPEAWAGGWPNFREGLSWWNSYLCWLTRHAAFECNLNGGYDVHACMQAAEAPPYTTSFIDDLAKGIIPTARNQNYLNVTNLSVQTIPSASAVELTYLDASQAPYPGTHNYLETFLTQHNAINWHNKTYRTTPIGACFTTWAKIGADAETNDLNTGWVPVPANSIGPVAEATLTLQPGFSTVYFTVEKDAGLFVPTQPHQVQFTWERVNGDGYTINHGYIALNEFEDTTIFGGLNDQTGYSAMVYPVVCYSRAGDQVKVQLSRNIAGPKRWLGRPIVLTGICSWFLEQ